MLFPKVYYYMTHTNGNSELTQLYSISSFAVQEDGTAVVGCGEHVIVYCVFDVIKDIWLVHRNNDYAAISHDFYLFCDNGIIFDIDDFPCDEEVRLYLHLKYTKDKTSHSLKWYKK